MEAAIFKLLADDEPPACTVERPDGVSPLLLVCDHAGNRIPRCLGTLGVSEDDRQRHIAWDVGAAELARKNWDNGDRPATGAAINDEAFRPPETGAIDSSGTNPDRAPNFAYGYVAEAVEVAFNFSRTAQLGAAVPDRRQETSGPLFPRWLGALPAIGHGPNRHQRRFAVRLHDEPAPSW